MSATCLCRSVVMSVNIFLSVSFCLRDDFRSVVCRRVVAQRKIILEFEIMFLPVERISLLFVC